MPLAHSSFMPPPMQRMARHPDSPAIVLAVLVTLFMQLPTSHGDGATLQVPNTASLFAHEDDGPVQAKRFTPFPSTLGRSADEIADLEDILALEPQDDKRAAFRSDLGKRFGFRSDLGEKRLSGFRSDLGKRGSSFRSDLGKRYSAFRGDLGKRASGFRSDLGKRAMFRGDLGKRFGFRSDLGKRPENVWDRLNAKRYYGFRNDLGKRSGDEDEKRFGFRSDLGKRGFRSDLGKRAWSGFRGDLGKRGFRMDLGKRDQDIHEGEDFF